MADKAKAMNAEQKKQVADMLEQATGAYTKVVARTVDNDEVRRGVNTHIGKLITRAGILSKPITDRLAEGEETVLDILSKGDWTKGAPSN